MVSKKIKSPPSPDVVAFLKETDKNNRCSICSNVDISRWISGCLVETKRASSMKPSISRVHREIKKAFPESYHYSDSVTRNHLREHEPEWINWGDED